MSKFQPGFTLIELLVVVTIILVLSGLGLVTYTGTQRKARDSKRKADLEQLRSALEMYRDDEDLYPIGTGSVSSTLGDLTSGNYIDSLPEDPKGYSYYYNSDANGYTYSLCAYLEGGGPDACGDNCSAPEDEDCNYQVNNP